MFCEICGIELKEGDLAYATTTGQILESIEGFSADENEWVHVICIDCSHKIDVFIGDLSTETDGKQDHIDCIVHCNNCGCNIFDQGIGISEVTMGGFAETEITFNDHDVQIHHTNISDPDVMEAHCRNCGQVLCDGEIYPVDIIDFYKGETDYLEAYIAFKGGAPVHGW